MEQVTWADSQHITTASKTPQNNASKTQSKVRSFNEIQVPVQQFPMGIIVMSEIWVKENPALFNYQFIALLGYSVYVKNHDS